MTETERAKQLANDHWNGYVSPLICNHADERRAYTFDEVLRLCKYHYLTAAVHFHGHGVEDQRGKMFETAPMDAARYAEIHTPLTPAEVNAITRPCRNCHDEDPCGGSLRMDNGDCLKYRPVIADQQHPRKEG